MASQFAIIGGNMDPHTKYLRAIKSSPLERGDSGWQVQTGKGGGDGHVVSMSELKHLYPDLKKNLRGVVGTDKMVRKEADLNTNVPGEDVSHLMQRLYAGNVNVSKVLDNAWKQHLTVPGYSPAVANVVKGPIINHIKGDLPKYMEVLKTKVKPEDIKTFIDKNPRVFDSVSNAVTANPIA